MCVYVCVCNLFSINPSPTHTHALLSMNCFATGSRNTFRVDLTLREDNPTEQMNFFPAAKCSGFFFWRVNLCDGCVRQSAKRHRIGVIFRKIINWSFCKCILQTYAKRILKSLPPIAPKDQGVNGSILAPPPHSLGL